ncbi:MAG: anaerobic ribonucleoside-triphosphate reductase [Methanocalculus sp.]|uniref:anaerobic ribonucleoside-triphosphate reductase n=1 Tax=Methanocalculus sp. TaxID=2004547 RepID=UPI002716D6A7|nr:anaerobic ribonucleoside-triphosphate reductase [Methanocalculus sp.]MDO8841761.1 anaerobic ribonucleoside-triphosphate reductase [Methanocalculus sp.]MDO9539681.1 anaerobic ribonucleoside-triphosphate reductase [Methanocalculus sp.]
MKDTRQSTLDGAFQPAMPKVRTSYGHMLDWDRQKIVQQILQETKLVETFYGREGAERDLAERVALSVENRIKKLGLTFLSGPLIREIMNMTLLEEGLVDYRNVCTRVGTPVYDAHLIDVGRGFEAKDNSNLQENAETSHKKKADKISKEQYLLQLPPELADLHLTGDMHIHDLEYFGSRPFCQDWDLRYFFYYGLMPDGNGTKASVAGPAKRAEVAVLHAVKALGSAQTNFAGGQGYYNFLTFLAPYVEGMDTPEIKQLMQMFVYEMTQMMVARGGQVVFSSVQLSPGVPKLWRDKPIVFKGKVWNGKQAPIRTYGEFEREVRLLFSTLMEVMLEGDNWGKPFNFPKPEISIEPDFMVEDEVFNKNHPDIPTYRDLYLMTFELASKFGTPYYDNQLPAYRGAGEGISCYQCCAYQFSTTAANDTSFEDKLDFHDGKHFSMGSWQVISVNCPRAAYRAEHDDQSLFSELKKQMDSAVSIFKIKRRWMELVRANGRMPFAMQRPKDPETQERGAVAVDLDGLVYTIGIVGVNEMVEHHIGSQLHETKEAFRFAVRTMTEMEQYAKKLSAKHGMTIALARTPAETTGQRFAVADLLDETFRPHALKVVKGDTKNLLERSKKTLDLPVYYTNGIHVTPSAKVPLTKRMEIEHVFFPIVDGGNIFHIWLGEARPDPRGLMDMAMQLCKTTQIGYFAFTRDLTVSLKQYTEYHSDTTPETSGSIVPADRRVLI